MTHPSMNRAPLPVRSPNAAEQAILRVAIFIRDDSWIALRKGGVSY